MSRARYRRELSQNFLVDHTVIDRMIRIARPSGLVLEPGGGSGALTRALTPHAEVWTWEIDPHWAAVLESSTSARVIRGDFARARVPDRAFSVVGNIPFSVTSRIVDWCLAARNLTRATLLTQDQYARKRTGGYGRWSRLTALTWHSHEWTYHGRVAPHAFRPRPRVDSGIIRLVRRPVPLLDPRDARLHSRVVHCAFLGLGGTVLASLSSEFGRAESARALSDAGVPAGSVVATVHPESWIRVARRLAREFR